LVENLKELELDATWYAVWTRSRQEKVAAAMLTTAGVRNYLPLKSEVRQWSDRKQTVELPLFSGYLFVNLRQLEDSKLKVLKVPGIVAFVGNQTGPLPIPTKEIEDIRTVLSAGLKCSVQPLLKDGDHVRVVRGPLTGVEGTLRRTNSEFRLLVAVDTIHQSISVRVCPEDVERIDANDLHSLSIGSARVA
jgi:transcription antitermination factor NusG